MNLRLSDHKAVLCIDIGSRTQDALIFVPGIPPTNMTRFVLPSPAILLAQQITMMTETRRDVYLHGTNMGGGFQKALCTHMESGCRVTMHPASALALSDNLAAVEAMGITLSDTCPAGFTMLRTEDINPLFWRDLCRMAGVSDIPLIAVAAQDHGFHPDGGNRMGRIKHWREFLYTSNGEGADPNKLIYPAAPPLLTRLSEIQKATGGPVADTGAAALLGMLAVSEIARRSHRQGVLLVNVGNTHIVAFLVYQERVFGVYEQHTFGITTQQIISDLSEFALGWLPNEQVIAAGGHGCIMLELPPEAEGFRPIYIAGPQRRMLRDHGQLAAPYDDIMQTGSFGLLHGLGLL